MALELGPGRRTAFVLGCSSGAPLSLDLAEPCFGVGTRALAKDNNKIQHNSTMAVDATITPAAADLETATLPGFVHTTYIHSLFSSISVAAAAAAWSLQIVLVGASPLPRLPATKDQLELFRSGPHLNHKCLMRPGRPIHLLRADTGRIHPAAANIVPKERRSAPPSHATSSDRPRWAMLFGTWWVSSIQFIVIIVIYTI